MSLALFALPSDSDGCPGECEKSHVVSLIETETVIEDHEQVKASRERIIVDKYSIGRILEYFENMPGILVNENLLPNSHARADIH